MTGLGSATLPDGALGGPEADVVCFYFGWAETSRLRKNTGRSRSMRGKGTGA